MLVEKLKITDHFLMRWLERVEGIDVAGALAEFYDRPARLCDESDFIHMMRMSGFDTNAMKRRCARLIGPAPINGQMQVGAWWVRTKDGNAVTVVEEKAFS